MAHRLTSFQNSAVLPIKEGYEEDQGYAQAERAPETFIARFESLPDDIRENERIQGCCYTPFADVMQELNVLAGIKRRVKTPQETIRSILQNE